MGLVAAMVGLDCCVVLSFLLLSLLLTYVEAGHKELSVRIAGYMTDTPQSTKTDVELPFSQVCEETWRLRWMLSSSPLTTR